MDICDRFREIRLSLSLSQPEMSERIGLSRNAWQTYELGKSTPGTLVYQELLKLGFSADWIMNGVGRMRTDEDVHDLTGYSFLPLFAAVGEMGPGRCCDEDIVDWRAFSDEWLRLELRSFASDLAIIVAAGDSMLPTICPGDILVIDHSKRYLRGDGIYVLNINGNCMVKRVQIMYDNSIRIVSDNIAYPPQVVKNGDMESIYITGRVIWHGKRV